MKFVCPHCERLVEVGRFRVDGDALVLECPRCAVESQSGGTARAGDAAVAPDPAPGRAGGGPSAAPEARPAAGPQHAGVAPARRPVSLASSPQASNVVVLRTSQVEAVENAARSVEGDPFAVPPGFCPKCLALRPGAASSCAQCGLIFNQLAPVTLEPPEWMSETWRGLLADWGNEPQHEGLRLRAARSGELVALARLYRIRLATLPEDPFAQRGRDEVLRLAAAPVSLLSEQRPDTSAEGTRWVVVAVLLLLTFAMLGGLAYQLFQAVK